MKRWAAERLVEHKLGIALSTVLFYLLVILPATVILFPDSSLWLSLLVVFIGFLAELKDLANELAEWLAEQKKLEAS